MTERDPYAQVKGKCIWWREAAVQEDVWDVRLKPADKRVACSCFIESKGWVYATAEVPGDCPESRACRYYIKNV